MKEILKAISFNNRIISIDILRGFALLGIIMVNVLGFNASFFDFGGFYNNIPNDFQKNFYSIYISLTADKFIFLFSFLFGYGIFMQYRRFTEKGKRFTPFFTKRMIVLALFGLLHIIFLWAGDILFLYAIAGFIILLILKSQTKWQLLFALFFYSFIGIWLTIDVWLPLPNALSSTCNECLKEAKIIYSNGNYFECMKLRLLEYYSFRNINLFYYLPKIIGITTFGLIASKYNLHSQLIENKKKWNIILIIITIIGTISYFGYDKIVDFNSPFADAIFMTSYEFMSLFIASTYLLLIFIFASNNIMAKILKPMALMGKMSLTNYLMQSVILSIIFYGWGLGMFGSKEITSLVLISLGIFIFQIIINIIWFKFYNQGPLEKIWRKLSYK